MKKDVLTWVLWRFAFVPMSFFTLISPGLNIAAQEEEDAEELAQAAPQREIEELVVTATKQKTDLMMTPVTVSAVGQEQLNDQGVTDVTALGDLVPNMQLGSLPSDSGVQVTVRGITSNNFTELGDPTRDRRIPLVCRDL